MLIKLCLEKHMQNWIISINKNHRKDKYKSQR